MTAELKTTIGQLSIARGSWRGDPPNQVAVREPKAPSADVSTLDGSILDTHGATGKGDLFVLVEVRGPVSNRDHLEQQLAETIRDAYYMARGAITASLRRALQEAGSQLYHHNVYSRQDQDPVIAGVAALVVKNEDIFIAQTGPTAIYAILSNYIRRYPTESPWLDEALTPERQSQLPALGNDNLAEPNLHHLRVSANDVLVLADSGLAGQLPLNEVIRAVTPDNVKATTKRLGKIAGANHCSAMVVAVEEARSTFNPLKRNSPAMFQGNGGATSSVSQFFKFGRGRPAKERADTPVAQPLPAAEAVAYSRPGPRPGPRLEPVMQAAAAPTGGSQTMSRFFDRSSQLNKTPASATYRHTQKPDAYDVPDAYEVPDAYDVPDEHPDREARLMASMAPDSGFTPTWRETHPSSSFSAGKVLRGLGTGLLMLIALLGTGLKNILALLLPHGDDRPASRQAGAHVYRNHTPLISKTLLRNVAIIIPLVAAIVVIVIYLQQGRLIEAEYSNHFAVAQNKYQQAQAISASDPATAVGLLEEAEVSLQEAEKIKANQPEVSEMRQKMLSMADEVGKVQRLYYLPQLRQYTDPGTRLNRIIVQGVELYVLDTGTDRIFHHRLDDLGETLLSDKEVSLVLAARGQEVEGVTVDDILDIVWMPAGGNRQTSDLMILNTTGLLEFNSNWGITTSALAGGELLALPVAVSSYFGNFYILDPSANRLLRYLPTADGYSASPDSYFAADQPVDLSNAVDFAIDGAVYVLFRDGKLNKFEGGHAVEFNISGMDKPFHNPVSIYTAPDEQVQYIYVADAGNQRIVQLEKDGRFVRQFKPRAGEEVTFANLQDIYVDEIGSRLYILDSNNLFIGNIPAETVE